MEHCCGKGRRNHSSLPKRLLQAGHSSLRQQKLESDAEDRCHYDSCRRAILCCRYGNWNRTRTSLRLRILHSNHAVILKSGPEIKNHCTLEGVNRQNLASIRKSGLEIQNRCTQEGINRQNLASIPKSGPEIKNRCTKAAHPSARVP